ncbi:MCE family protein [Streptomyces sp. DSM 44917]|uniref:MCE family protein n=1 Tax=Streptomyces boetiae TaxID=3075541 RepID=A0ABU2L8X2_9ACTN|nr:MCE family protein [Streptomyces sp. DSM 44917]MDT0307947.1 MCE family protein [Streptomyces sp. DSM 44917]
MRRLFTRTRLLLALAGVVVLVLLANLVGVINLFGSGTKEYIAYFDRTVGVRPGSDVRILGVRVGEVNSVTPEGTQVRVSVSVDEDVEIPAEAQVAVIYPSIVADRYIQFTPAYTGGEVMEDGAVVPLERTAIPLEVDDLYESLTEISDALGPEGANADGALTDLLNVGAENLDGRGREMANMIDQFSGAAGTIGDSSDNLFATIESLAEFTSMLEENDDGVRQAEEQLADVASFLAEDRDELAAALDQLSTALGQVESFIGDNRQALTANVNQLADLTQSLVDQRASLAEALDAAPNAVGNVLNAYNPRTRAFDTRGNLNEVSMVPLTTSESTMLLPLSGGNGYRLEEGGAE